MKITIRDKLKVELSSLVRLEWNNFLPVLTIHEKFEKQIKWTLRVLTFIGIATSNANTPPTYLIHAADDNIALVGQSLVYYQALHRNKVPSQMMVYQQGGHGFSVYNKPLDHFWTKGVVNWLKLNKLL